MNEKFFCLALSMAVGIGEKRFFTLVNYFGSAKSAWNAGLSDFKKLGLGEKVFDNFSKFRSGFDIGAYSESLLKRNIKFAVYYENFYPENLAGLKEKPPVLFYKGGIENINWPRAIAVVGTRKMTSYGRSITEKIAGGLLENNFVIVSGLALGVDALSHKTALDVEGKTVAVLGSGVDICYPRENEYLYEQIIQQGGAVISAFPPGTRPSLGTFPARNRIISALSLGVLVTEAGCDSGSLITAAWAKEMNRPVFAVPGSIDSAQSKGAIQLLKKGAVLVENAKDILAYFKFKENKVLKNSASGIDLSEEERSIINFLENEPMQTDHLARESGKDIGRLNILLSMLELKGAVRNLGGGKFEKTN